jgi:hypothetical protein
MRFTLPFVLSLLAGPAAAESITVQCADSRPFVSGTVICLTQGQTTFRSDGPEVEFFIRIAAPATHCSPVSYMITRPGGNFSVGSSSKLSGGQSENITIGRGYTAGDNILTITAIGYPGEGCNTGAIHSFGAEVSVSPVP